MDTMKNLEEELAKREIVFDICQDLDGSPEYVTIQTHLHPGYVKIVREADGFHWTTIKLRDGKRVRGARKTSGSAENAFTAAEAMLWVAA